MQLKESVKDGRSSNICVHEFVYVHVHVRVMHIYKHNIISHV